MMELLRQQREMMAMNQQLVATMLRRMDLEEERRNKAEEKVHEAAEAAKQAAEAAKTRDPFQPSTAPASSSAASSAVSPAVPSPSGYSGAGGRAEKYLPNLPVIDHQGMGKGRMKEVETWHSFMETLSSWLALQEEAFVRELQLCIPVKKEIVQADLNPETAARSSKLFYYLTQSLAKWERGSELLRSCSKRQGQSACGYEVIRTITSQYSIVSRMEAVFVREQALKLYQHVGHLKRPTDLIRHLEDSFSKSEAKLSNFPELQLSEADRCSVLLQSLGAEVRQYVVLHGSSSNWEALRRTLTYYEEQLRLCEAPGSSGRALQEKLCDYCGKKGHTADKCWQRQKEERGGAPKGKGKGDKGKPKGKGDQTPKGSGTPRGSEKGKGDKGKGDKGKDKGKKQKKKKKGQPGKGRSLTEPESEAESGGRFRVVKKYDRTANLFNASGGAIVVSGVVDLEVHFGDVFLRLEEVLVADVGFNVVSPWTGSERGWKTYLAKSGSRLYKGNGKKSIKLMGASRAWWALSGRSKGRGKENSSRRPPKGIEDMEIDALKDRDLLGSSKESTAGPQKPGEGILKKGRKTSEEDESGRHALAATPFGCAESRSASDANLLTPIIIVGPAFNIGLGCNGYVPTTKFQIRAMLRAMPMVALQLVGSCLMESEEDSLPLEIIMDGASGDEFTPSVALSSPGSPGDPPTPPALESPSFELPGVEPPGGGPSSPVAVYPSPVVTEAAESPLLADSADGPSQADAAGSPVEENTARSPPKADIAESPLFSESEGEESWGHKWPNPSKRLRAGVPSEVEGPTPPRVGIPANISPGSLSPPFGALQMDVGTQLLLRVLRLEAGRRWEHAETLGLAKVSVDSTEPIPLLSHLAGIPANMNDAYDAPSLAFCAPGHALRALCSPTATMLGPIGLPDLEHPAAWLPATPVIPVTAAYPEEPLRVSRPKMVESEAQCIIGQQEWEVWLGRCLEGKSLAEYGLHMEDVGFAVRVTELLEAPRAARAAWKRRFQEPNPVSMLHYLFHCRAVLQTYLATPAGYRGLVGARSSLLVKVPQSVTSLELKTAWAYLDSGIYLRVARYYRRKREEERLHEARESMRAARAKSAAIPQGSMMEGGVVDTSSSSSDEESLLLGEGEVTALNRAQGQEDLSDIAIWRTLEELTGQRLSQLDGFVGADEGNQPAEAGQPAPPSPAPSSVPPGELVATAFNLPRVSAPMLPEGMQREDYQRHGVNIPPSVPPRSRLPTPPRAMSSSATGQTAQARQALEEGQRLLENGFTPGLDLGIIVRKLQRENQTIGLDFFYFGKLRVLLMMHLGSKYTVSLPAMHLDDPDLLHNINRVIREMGLVGKAVTSRMDQEAALGALAEKLTQCDSSPASATLIDVVPGYRPQSKGSIERQVETMKQGFWSVWMDLEKEVAKVKQETEAVELGKYQLPLGGLLWQACVFYVARCYNLWCTSVGDSSTSIDRLHEEIVNRTRTRPFGCLVQAQVSKSKAHHDKFRGARTVKAVYLGPVHAKGGGIFAVPVGSREIDIFPVARMIQGGDIYDAKTLEELSLAKPLLQDTEDPERPILFDPLEAPGDDAPDEGAGVGMDEDGDEEMIEDELADYSPSEAPENQEVVNDEGDMEIDWLTNHYLESLFRGPDLRATSTAVAKSFDLKFGGTKIRCAVPQNAVSETSGEKLEPDLLYASMKLELEELESFKVGEVIPEREARRLAKENGRRVLTSRWVNTVKKKGLYRSRLVVRDYASMGGTTLSEGIYSPTTSLEGLRLLLSMLCRRGSVLSCDVSVAFMHAPVARAEFVELPNNVSTQGTGERVFVKLRKAMNGLRSAPLSWYCELAEYLRSQNFEASLDPTIFRRLTRKGLTIVLFYVDDLLIYSEDEAEGRRFYEELRKRYKLKLTGELIQDCPGEVSFLGRRIFRRKKGERTVYFGLDEQYLSSCCEEYGITKPAPKLPSLERRYAELLKKGQTELISPAAHERYRRTLGRLAWAALSRPDLQFVCGFLGRHQAAPDEAAETCMRDVLRWVKGLPHKVQRFPSKREILEDDADPASVSCFTDASWSLNSVSGGIITWENCSLKSFSRKQTTTALSSAEAELAALTEVAREGLYIALLVETIREGMPKDRETGYYVLKGYSDSESAVCISKMQTLLRKVRHIELRAAFLQELVARGRFTIEHIPGVINPADALTKSPTNESLSSLYDASGLVDEPKAWESEPTEVHVSFEEPNENERFTPSVPPSWKAAALHLRFKKGGKALEKWRAALAVHKRSWKRIEKLLEPYVGSPNLLLSHEWPERVALWIVVALKRVTNDLGADVASLEACILVLSNRRQQTHKDWCKSVRPPRQSKERKPGKAALALHTVWEKLTPEARLAIEEAGWRPPSAAAVVPPPGLGDFDVDMDASEACEAKQKLWSEATEQQKELMLKAGLKPPEQTPAPTSYEVGTAANAAFRKATVALKLLGDKKISLQKRIDQAKEQYNARLTEMKQLQTKIEEAQQQVADAGEELTTKVLAQDESLNGEIAQFLEKFGISLTEEQEAKIAAVRAGTHGPPDSQAFDLKAAAPNTQEVPKKSEPAQNGVAVRPAGCTQADQVLVHSTWSGSALAQSGDPGVSALWASLLQGLEHMCHVQVLQAVEALEAGQYILEDTFPWFAAELAVEAGDDVPWHVAASAIRDVIANLNSNADGNKLLLVSSNVTKWRKSLATFLAGIRPDLWLVQETHIKEEQGDLLANHVGAFGYQAFSLPGHPTGGGGNSGGLAIVFKKHLDVRKSHHFLHQGVGFQSVVLRIRGVDIFLVNVYLKTGEGFRGPTNAIILSNLIPFLRSLQGEFLVAGDFNEDISVLVTTSLAQEARGQWVHTGASTCTGGGNIDFGLVSKGLALGVSVRADWITPFAPHAALHWCIDRRQCELRFPQLVGFKPMPIMPQPFEPPLAGCSGPQPDLESACAGHWGGSIPEPALTHTFEQLSSSVELSVYGCTQGRGCLPKFRRDKLLRHTSPVGAWGGAQASFWKRVLVWLELSVKRSCPAPFGHTFWSQLELMWHGSTAELSVFQVQLDAVLKGVTPSAFPELIQVSEQQFRHHSKLWMQKQSASYGKWLKQASCKGLRGLFTSVKADEAVQLRPFLHQPVQERIYLRWRQWFELWSAPGGVDPALLSDLRQRARMQAKELGPIPLDQAVAAFKRVPSKAPGLDGWTFEMLKNLQRPAVASIISFLHHCETEATWPAQMVFALIALLPKSEKRERPIALLHVLYRTWVRMRWKLVSDWQFQYCKAAVWDKAMPGSQVLDVALGRLLRGEAARQSGQHLVTIFIDMETFYDRCRFNDVISSGLSLGYPPLVLHQALLTYMGPRFLQSEGSLCPAITPAKGVLAGCPAAPSISKLVVHPIAVAATSKRATSNLDVWIDDLSLDCVGASAKQIASDAVLLFRSLRTSIEATGAKLLSELTQTLKSAPLPGT
ncbi:unnamed protein product [Symbiodinium sp. CCMP2592]|nr:unnamed protein product [Symbiodinium sp. CCMP2592]